MQDRKNMILVTTQDVGQDGRPSGKTFRLLPLSNDCPYQIGHYSVESGSLLLITKEKKLEPRTMPALTETGEYKKNKAGQVVVERRLLDDFTEFGISDPESIKMFIEATCINGDRADMYIPLIAKVEPIVKTKMESPSLILQP